MPAIKTDNGPGLAASIADARPLLHWVMNRCKGEPVERAVTALTLALARIAVRAGMSADEFSTYTSQQFALIEAASKGTGALEALAATLPRVGGSTS